MAKRKRRKYKTGEINIAVDKGPRGAAYKMIGERLANKRWKPLK